MALFEGRPTEEPGGGPGLGGVPGGGDPPPAPPGPAPNPAEDPRFATMSREFQKMVEAGMSLEEALSKWEAAGSPTDGPDGTPGPPAPGGGGGGPGPPPAPGTPPPETRPINPAPAESGTNVRLDEGVRSDVPGTYARPGTRSYGAFQGRAFGQDILPQMRPGATAEEVMNQLSQRAGLPVGSVGRLPISGMAGGMKTAGEALGGLGAGSEDELIKAALQAQGL
jgi:hypothetical protein